jgi:hypothetical protein
MIIKMNHNDILIMAIWVQQWLCYMRPDDMAVAGLTGRDPTKLSGRHLLGKMMINQTLIFWGIPFL